MTQEFVTGFKSSMSELLSGLSASPGGSVGAGELQVRGGE